MIGMLAALGHALWLAFAMFWAILWPLILGFTVSAVIQGLVSKQQMARVLGDDRPLTLAKACGLGAAWAARRRIGARVEGGLCRSRPRR